MFWNLLADAENTSGGSDWLMYAMLIILVAAIVLWLVFSGRKNKSRQKEYIEQLEAIKPGHKVKSGGGLCGVVVEVCDDNTVIVETGSEKSGKSYFKLDKECIYQTDAKGPTQIAREEAEARRQAEKEAKKLGHAPEAPAPAPEAEPAEQEAPVEEEKSE